MTEPTDTRTLAERHASCEDEERYWGEPMTREQIIEGARLNEAAGDEVTSELVTWLLTHRKRLMAIVTAATKFVYVGDYFKNGSHNNSTAPFVGAERELTQAVGPARLVGPWDPKATSGLTFDVKLALENYELRKTQNKGKQVDNSRLPAGSPMHYYCRFCGEPTETLPEGHIVKPSTCCDPCQLLHNHGVI